MRNPKPRKNRPVLTFCIPSYNRSKKTLALVSEILKYRNDDIEVLVQDNCSTDDTKSVLSSVSDPRFVFRRNPRNIGGIKGVIKALTMASGEYALLCLDKDSIRHKNIGKLVSFLKKNSGVVFGFCSLDILKESPAEIFPAGAESLRRVGYLSKHPTGFFYRNDVLKKLDIFNRFTSEDPVMAFVCEFINGEMSMLGDTAIVGIPLCFTEKREEASGIKSYTYTDKNLFFLPKMRFRVFSRYAAHIMTLPVSRHEHLKQIRKVFRQELTSATVGYRSICRDEHLCAHYRCPPRNIGLLKLAFYDISFCASFLFRCSYPAAPLRAWICVAAHFEIASDAARRMIGMKPRR